MSDKINAAVDLAASLRKKVTPIPAGLDALKVDPLFEEDPVVTRVLEFAIKRRVNTLIYGPTGCGKSCLVLNVMARLQEQCEHFSCDGETNTDELIGKPWITTDKSGQSITEAIYGAAVRAYLNGSGLLLEEVDFAAPDVMAALHRIMEVNQNYYVMNVGQREVIPKSPRFFVVGTANTIGTGDDDYNYTGTKIQNIATTNRWTYCIKMSYLAETKELKVVKAKTGIPDSIARLMVKVANDSRDAADPTRIKGGALSGNRTSVAISTRDLLAWANAVVGLGFSPKEAASFSFLNRTNERDREVIGGLVDNQFR